MCGHEMNVREYADVPADSCVNTGRPARTGSSICGAGLRNDLAEDAN
jgi:hypothetical protein